MLMTRLLAFLCLPALAIAAANEDAAGAIEKHRQLLKAQPASALHHYNLGHALYLAKRSSEAIVPLQQALKLQPGMTAARDLLAASLAETGRCEEALPSLRKAVAQATDVAIKRSMEVAGLRCSLTLNRTSDALTFIQFLHRDFPADPDILYMLVHAHSDLSLRASRDLLHKAPGSHHVHQLNAEALETQGKWDDAVVAYRKVLEINPNAPGIHFRLGRLLLSRPGGASSSAEARREFEAELKLNPQNAGAEFVLGELARRDGEFEAAIGHFSRAVQYDRGFAAAHLALGKSLLGASRDSEAIAPLQAAASLDPRNPEPAFHLSTALRRSGRDAEADKYADLHKRLSQAAQQQTDAMRRSVDGLPAAPR